MMIFYCPTCKREIGWSTLNSWGNVMRCPSCNSKVESRHEDEEKLGERLEWESSTNWAESTKYMKYMGDVRLLELITFIRNCNIPDDAEIWIEYPERYGTAQPKESIFRQVQDEPCECCKTDFIRAMSYSYSKKDNILYIRHHY